MSIRSATEVVVGALYAIGTIHQGLFVLRDSEAFYTDMADQAILGAAEVFVGNTLVPNSVVVTVLVVALQGSLAIAILSRGSLVSVALLAGGVFSIVGALTGSLAELIGYSLLAGLHFWLLRQRRTGEPRESEGDLRTEGC